MVRICNFFQKNIQTFTITFFDTLKKVSKKVSKSFKKFQKVSKSFKKFQKSFKKVSKKQLKE